MSRMRQTQRRAVKRPVVAAQAPAVPQEGTEVRVKFMGELPAVVGGRSVVLSLPPGSTVQDLLAQLSATYGETFTARVFSSSGKLHHYIIVFVDGAKVDMPAGLQRTLGRGEVDVVMLPMFAGG